MPDPRLSVVIPSWNGAEPLAEHLPSVLAAADRAGGAEVIVADDGSDDGTAAEVPGRFAGVRVASRPVNGGFAKAANAGVAAASARLVLLLNNDMEVEPDAFRALLAAVEADERVFAAVPSIVRKATGVEESGTVLRFRRGVVSAGLAQGTIPEPAYGCGGAMLFRKSVFDGLGGFDELFSPFYWEDVDLSYRARKRGLTVHLAPGARVIHDHGRTIGARFDGAAVSRIYERNRLIFTWKNLTDPPLWRSHLAMLPAKAAWDLARHRAFARGLVDAWRLRSELRGRRSREVRDGRVPDRALLREDGSP